VLTVVLSIGLGMLAAWAGLTLGARLGLSGDGGRKTRESTEVEP